MLESIDRAGAIGWGTIITVIALAIFLIPNAIEGWNRFLKSIGLAGSPAGEGNRRDL